MVTWQSEQESTRLKKVEHNESAVYWLAVIILYSMYIYIQVYCDIHTYKCMCVCMNMYVCNTYNVATVV